MQKWEYFTFVESGEIVNIPEILRPLGESGWELVSYVQTMKESVFIFKRPKK